VQHALAVGLSQDIVDSIGKRQTDRLPHPYSLLHAILEKAMAWLPVPEDLQSRAVAQWGREGLVEIVVLSGFYQMFAAINQGFDIKAQATED
jgi:4-carboxymuconolactone decarboxylase